MFAAFFTWVSEAIVGYFAGITIESIITNLIISWAIDEVLGESFENDNKGILLNKSSNNAPIPVVYGERKVGGIRSFVGTSGTDNTHLWIVLTLAEGEIESIDDIYIDDVLLESGSKHFSDTVITKYLGTDTQTADAALVAANIGWTTNHRLRGLAYVVCKFTWNRDAFGSLPVVNAVIKGKKVFDPRNSTTAYSSNPALCLRDYLTNSRYGKGLASSAIDDTLFGTAATRCESQVTPYSGAATQNIFSCNAVVNTDKSLISNTRELMSGCRGLMPYQGGKFGLIIEDEKIGSTVFDFDESHIIGGIMIESEKKSTKYNRVVITYPNPNKNWQTDTVDWPVVGSTAHNDYMTEDSNVDLIGRLSLPTITNFYTASDIAELVVKRSRAGLKVAIQCTSEALKCQVGDVVSITHSTPDWTAKEFRVMLTSLKSDGTVTLNLIEHQDNIYPWGTKTQEASQPSTNLPDPFSVVAPTSLAVNTGSSNYLVQADGAIIVRANVTWTARVDQFVNQYVIQWKYASGSVYANEVTTSANSAYISGFKTGESIDVRVKAVSSIGVSSAWVIVSATTVTAHATAPAVPTGLTATAKQGAIELSWTNPTDTDFAYVEINRHTSNSQGASSLFVKTSNTTIVDQVGESATRYYWARSFNRSSVASAWTSVVVATSTTYPVAAAASPTLAHNGLVYFATNQASAPATPSASSYSFATGSMTSLTSNWSITPPVLNIGQSDKYWSSRWAVEETTSGGGTGTPTFQTAIAQFTFDGVVTFSNSTSITNGTDTLTTNGLLASGDAAADINANVTTIDGSKITTGSVTADYVTSNISLTSPVITGGTIKIGTGNTPSGNSFEVASNGMIWTDLIVDCRILATNFHSSTSNAIYASTRHAKEAIIGLVSGTNSSTSAHGIRGINYYSDSATGRVSTSGLVGTAANFDFYADGGGTNYGPFTGAHDCLVANSNTVSIGDLVVDVECVARRGLSNTLFEVETSSSTNQAACIGVVVADNGALSNHSPAAFITGFTDDGVKMMSSGYELAKNNYQLMAINAVGEGQLNITGEGGNLTAGDLIVASSTAGKGMKQADDFVRSYTVARVRESVSFSSPNEQKLVACIYLCG